MEDIKNIRVMKREGRKSGQTKLIIHNPTSLRLIGQGTQGAVFKLPKNRCVKIHARMETFDREKRAMEIGKDKDFMPKLYDAVPTYLVMEHMDGPNLIEYLGKKRKLPKWMVKQIIYTLRDMEELGFTRIDMPLRHIFVTKQHILKVIDHVNAFRTKRSEPVRMLKDLKKAGYLKKFLKQVKNVDPKVHQRWKRVVS